MSEIDPLLKTGNYSQKQFFSKSFLMRYSHKKRFEFITNYIAQKKPENLLDYGCGDGTFLIHNNQNIVDKFGFDLSDKQIIENKERIQINDSYTFFNKKELDSCNRTFKVITCMEVMEHCTQETIESLLSNFNKLLDQNGELIISVPIETGLAVVIKQTVRRGLGMLKFGNYEYTEAYSFIDLMRAIFANDKTNIKRLYYDVETEEGPYTTCSHYAFNWMKLRETIKGQFKINDIKFTPLNFLGGGLNSQVWFFCSK